jgi:hypothetical protein
MDGIQKKKMVEAFNTIANNHATMRELYLADVLLQRSPSTEHYSASFIQSIFQGLEIPKLPSQQSRIKPSLSPTPTSPCSPQV